MRLASVLPVLIALQAPASLGAQRPSIVQIAASRHILVLLSDGTVAALGENPRGQLGRPKTAPLRFLPTGRVELPGKVVQVAVGDEDASYALLEDGTVWAWGAGVSRNLGVPLDGVGERHTPGQVPGLNNVIRIVARKAAVMAVLRDGSVRAWGEVPPLFTGGVRQFPGVATPVPIAGLANIADIAGGVDAGYALTRDGQVYAWGPNLKGEIGTGTTSDAVVPPTLVPGVSGVVSIAMSFGAAVAVARDGRVWSWGSNEQGGLGLGTDADNGVPAQPTPAPLPILSDAVEVKAGTWGRQFIVRRRNGTLIGWGNSDWGQLGAGISGNFQLKATPIKLPDVEAYWLGGNFAFARTKDGGIWFWGGAAGARPLLGARGNQRVPARVPLEKLVP